MKSFGMRAMAEAAKARERVKEAAEKGAAFIETNMANVSQSLVTDDDDDGFPFGGAIGSAKKTPPRTPQGSARAGLRRDDASGSASQPSTPIGPAATDDANGIFVPASSAMKLRFFDAADVAGVVKAHLEEKMALAEEHERVWMALEKVVEGGGRTRVAAWPCSCRRTSPPPRGGRAKPRMARTESRCCRRSPSSTGSETR